MTGCFHNYRPQTKLREGYVFAGRNEVLAKVIFFYLSVILFTGGGGVWQGDPPWLDGDPLRLDGGNPPSWMEETPSPPAGWRNPPPGSGLRHTVYDRPVRILLECILVTGVCDSVHKGGGGHVSQRAPGPHYISSCTVDVSQLVRRQHTGNIKCIMG